VIIRCIDDRKEKKLTNLLTAITSGEARSENTEILLYEDEKLHGEGAK
jgi:hypothetical protein